MIVDHYIAFQKTQKKMFDCWYACIQMVRSAAVGAKTKPDGPLTQAHRSRWALGRKLNFGGPEGTAILKENNLVDIAPRIKFDRMLSLATQLHEKGPVIVGGKFALLNSQGHFIVISGCNTDTEEVSICDPGWGHGKEKKTWGYIAKHAWKMTGDENEPDAGAFVADGSGAFASKT